MEGFPRGAFAACEGGGLEEPVPAPWGVFRVYFRGIGLGRREGSVCPVEDCNKSGHWGLSEAFWRIDTRPLQASRS